MEDGLLVTLRLTIFFLATRSVSCCCRFRVQLEEGGGGGTERRQQRTVCVVCLWWRRGVSWSVYRSWCGDEMDLCEFITAPHHLSRARQSAESGGGGWLGQRPESLLQIAVLRF
jgi:hypothetical protein